MRVSVHFSYPICSVAGFKVDASHGGFAEEQQGIKSGGKGGFRHFTFQILVSSLPFLRAFSTSRSKTVSKNFN